MYGNVDYQIMQAIAAFMSQWRGDNMDPTLNSLAYKLRHEMVAETAQWQTRQWERGKHLLHRLGALLVTLGQRMQAAPEADGYPCLENEACV
jgi:hypothetical protein